MKYQRHPQFTFTLFYIGLTHATKLHPYFIIILFSITSIAINSCKGQTKAITESQQIQIPYEAKEKDLQIAEYIRNIYQDKEGNLWFGTNGYGVAHYNGDSISYYAPDNGFGGGQITGMTEDPQGNIWFATSRGVVLYEWETDEQGKKQFTNFTDWSYFRGQRMWSIYADSKGTIWAGAEQEVFKYDGILWSIFEIPYPEKISGNFITKATSWTITEDKAGNMWFSTNGFGAYKYDGQSFTQYSEKDGLTNNEVDQILKDSDGNIWFGTRFGGVSRFDGEEFTTFSQRDNVIGNDEVCEIYEDSQGNIWMSSEGYGVYRYAGETFTNFSKDQGLGVRAVQAIFEDREGRFWVGGGGGLYRFDGERFHNITKDGPW